MTMMKLTALSLLAASASAFTVLPKQTASTTALFYYKEGSRFDIVGGTQKDMVLAERQGRAILQGGSDVGWFQSPEECGMDGCEAGSYYIQPHYDVLAEHGSLVNAEPIGPSKVQGGSENDWSYPGGVPAPVYQNKIGARGATSAQAPQISAPVPQAHRAPAPNTSSYLSSL
jgi:hypothetical protein